MKDTTTAEDVLAFWFPEGLEDADAEAHQAFWKSRMRGGMDDAIIADWAGVTEAAARGAFDGWEKTPRGRLALILVLDQFPRSLWRDTPAAYGQDVRACRLAMEGIANGHYDALDHPWQKNFYQIAISHCEGPDHLERMELILGLARELVLGAPERLRGVYQRPVDQVTRVQAVIARFGRHPHRNAILGRVSTPEEEAYIAEGAFPHETEIPSSGG